MLDGEFRNKAHGRHPDPARGRDPQSLEFNLKNPRLAGVQIWPLIQAEEEFWEKFE